MEIITLLSSSETTKDSPTNLHTCILCEKMRIPVFLFSLEENFKISEYWGNFFYIFALEVKEAALSHKGSASRHDVILVFLRVANAHDC